MNSEIYDVKESQKASTEGSSTDAEEEYREYKYRLFRTLKFFLSTMTRFVIMALYIGVALTNQLLWVTCSPITTNLQQVKLFSGMIKVSFPVHKKDLWCE